MKEIYKREQEQSEVSKRIKYWQVYLNLLPHFIKQKHFQIPFIASKRDPKNSTCLYLTLATVMTAEILKTINQWRQGSEISLYTIKTLKAHEIIPIVPSNISFQEFYQQHQESNRFFWVIDDSGAVRGYLSPKIIENQSKLQTSEKRIIELMQEINFTDLDKISVKFESFNQQTRILKVSLNQEYIDSIPANGLIANSTIGDLHQIRVQIDALERLRKDGGNSPILDKFIYGSNEELELSPIPSVEAIPIEKCLNKILNDSQRQAITAATASPDLFCIQGPPGTGKSTVILELCYQFVLQGKRVLVCCQSHLPIDNILSGLPNHPDIRIIRLGDSKKVSEKAQDLVGKNAVKRYLKLAAEKSSHTLVELEKNARLVDLFIIHWEEIYKWAYWQQEKSRLLADAEKIKIEVVKGTKDLQNFKQTNLCINKIQKLLQELIQLPNNQVISEYSNELWQSLTQITISKSDNIWTHRDANLLELAIYLQQQLSNIKPGGKVFQLQENCEYLCSKIETIIIKLQDSIDVKKDIKNSFEKVSLERENQDYITDRLEHILNYGITSDSKAVSLSSTYTNTYNRLSKFKNLITLKKSFVIKRNKFLELFLDALKILRCQSKIFVQLIRSWPDAEINLLPEAINQYEYIYDKLVNLKILASLPIVGRLYKKALHRAEEQLKNSIENISDESHFFHTQKSPLAKKIYEEYKSALKKAEVKADKIFNQYDQERKRLKTEECHYNLLIEEDVQSILDDAKAYRQLFNETFPLDSKRPLITIDESLNIENLTQISKSLQIMADYIKDYINSFENQTILPFKDLLVCMYNSSLSLSNEHVHEEQSLLNKVNSLSQEYNQIINDIKTNDDKYELGHQRWEELRVQKIIPQLFNKPVPDYEMLNIERDCWLKLESVGGEAGARKLKTKLQIKKDEIARNKTGNIEISDELYKLYLEQANVVGATCIHTGRKDFLEYFSEFDVVIIDEVSKATATELLIACLLGKKIILVGDHKQLPPVFGEESCLTEAANALGIEVEELRKKLSTSIFKERYEYLDEIKASRTFMLTQQYRMHSQIMEAINPFYGGQLTMGFNNQDNKRVHRIKIQKWLSQGNHLVWADLPVDKSEWHHEQVGTGRQNLREAEFITLFLEKIAKNLEKKATEPKKTEIGITSVYKAQTNLIKTLVEQKNIKLPKNVTLTIGTVDEFQGLEKDIMFVSLVLNEPNVLPSEFLRTPERINVAMSRARNLLIITGSSHNYTELESESSLMYKHILDTAKKHKGYLKADELMD